MKWFLYDSFVMKELSYRCSCQCLFLNNPFRAKVPIYFIGFQYSEAFLYPLKASENRRFSDVFRGYRNAAEYSKELI